MKWVAFFSHTGNEIAHISNRLGRWPDLVITNQSKETSASYIIKENTLLFNSVKKPTVSDYHDMIKPFSDEQLIVTLHGWMRVIPADICNSYNIYNLHPGLITKYPELKGKDPQDRISDTQKYIGCVIHQVSPLVDSGEIISEYSVLNPTTRSHIIRILKDMAGNMWYNILQYKLC